MCCLLHGTRFSVIEKLFLLGFKLHRLSAMWYSCTLTYFKYNSGGRGGTLSVLDNTSIVLTTLFLSFALTSSNAHVSFDFL